MIALFEPQVKTDTRTGGGGVFLEENGKLLVLDQEIKTSMLALH